MTYTMKNCASENKINQRVNFLNKALFGIFLFIYLSCFQDNYLVLTQHLISNSKTIYSPIIGAIIISVLLLALQNFVNKHLKFGTYTLALSFIPSTIIVTLITCIIPSIPARTLIGSFLLLAVMFLFSYIAKRIEVSNKEGFVIKVLNVNIWSLIIQFLFITSFSNTDDLLHLELKTEKYIVEGKYHKALHVGYKTLASSARLTALRSVALLNSNQLADKLFEYPQYYGSEGLLLTNNDSLAMLFKADLQYQIYGHKRGDNQTAMDYFSNLIKTNKNQNVIDSYLCALLLDKNIDLFANEITKYYDINKHLPKSFAQALTLYMKIRTKPILIYQNDNSSVNLQDFSDLQHKYKSFHVQASQTYNDYSDTYWWYYYYQQIHR